MKEQTCLKLRLFLLLLILLLVSSCVSDAAGDKDSEVSYVLWSGFDPDIYEVRQENRSDEYTTHSYTLMGLSEESIAGSEKRLVGIGTEKLFGFDSLASLIDAAGFPTRFNVTTEGPGEKEYFLTLEYGAIDLFYGYGSSHSELVELRFDDEAAHFEYSGWINIGTTIEEMMEYYPEITQDDESTEIDWEQKGVYFYGYNADSPNAGYLNMPEQGFRCFFWNGTLFEIYLLPLPEEAAPRFSVIKNCTPQKEVTQKENPVQTVFNPDTFKLPPWEDFDEELYTKKISPPEEGDDSYWIDYTLKVEVSDRAETEQAIIDVDSEGLFSYASIDAFIQDFGTPYHIVVVSDGGSKFNLNLFYGGIHLYYGNEEEHTHIKEIRFRDASLPVLVNGGLAVGDSIEQVKGLYSHVRDALPEEYINGEQDYSKTGIYYSGMHEGSFGYLELPDEGIRMFFWNDMISALYLPFSEGLNPVAGTIEWVE